MMPLSLLSSVDVGLVMEPYAPALPEPPAGRVEQGLPGGGDAELLARLEQGLILWVMETA